MISVVIPVYNEQRALPGTLTALLSQQGDYEVIVVDGGSCDASRDIVKTFTQVALVHAPRGRASQMNAGARLAKGEWLLFLHADTTLPVGALSRLDGLRADTGILAGGFRHSFTRDTWRLRLISRLHNFRCRCTRVFYGDQAPFIRRVLFEQLGGFPEVLSLEDLLMGERIASLTRPVLLDETVVTDSRRFEQQGVWRSLTRVLLIQLCHELKLPVFARKFFSVVR